MKRSGSRILAVIAAAAVSTVGLAACSSGATGGGSTPASSITLWHLSADSPAVLQLYKDFTKATGIKVNLVSVPSDSFETTTLTKWATGARPDILEYHPDLSSMLPLNPEKNMQDLSGYPFVKKSGDLYTSNGSYDGKVYAAITGFPQMFGLYYNKAVFKSAGLEPPTSFADLTSDCAVFKSKGIPTLYESGTSLWTTQVLPSMFLTDLDKNGEYTAKIATNKAKLTDPSGPFVKALTAYHDLDAAGCFNKDASTGTFEKALASVYDGSAAMTALHSDVYSQLLTNAGNDAQKLADTVGFASVSSASPSGLSLYGPRGKYIAPETGDAAHEAAAIKFIEYATGAGYSKLIQDGKAFPVISGYPDPTDITSLQKSFKTSYANSQVALLGSVAGFGSFATEMGKVLNDQETPEQAAANMQSSVQQASKAAGIPGW